MVSGGLRRSQCNPPLREAGSELQSGTSFLIG